VNEDMVEEENEEENVIEVIDLNNNKQPN